jgi:hypothetical protein
MNTSNRFGVCAALTMTMSLAASAALSASTTTPDATITFHEGGVGFIAGVNWGAGTLHYMGRDYPLKVSGLSVGAIGAGKFHATGNVYNLRQVSDIEGTYGAVAASATVVGGAGALDMTNGAGVEIKAHSTSAGLHLKLGPSGVTIKLKK